MRRLATYCLTAEQALRGHTRLDRHGAWSMITRVKARERLRAADLLTLGAPIACIFSFRSGHRPAHLQSATPLALAFKVSSCCTRSHTRSSVVCRSASLSPSGRGGACGPGRPRLPALPHIRSNPRALLPSDRHDVAVYRYEIMGLRPKATAPGKTCGLQGSFLAAPSTRAREARASQGQPCEEQLEREKHPVRPHFDCPIRVRAAPGVLPFFSLRAAPRTESRLGLIVHGQIRSRPLQC